MLLINKVINVVKEDTLLVFDAIAISSLLHNQRQRENLYLNHKYVIV